MEAQAKGAPELLGNLGNMGALATYRGSNKNSLITAQKTFLMTAPFFFFWDIECFERELELHVQVALKQFHSALIL